MVSTWVALRARAQSQTVLRAPVDGAGLPRARFFVKVLIVFKFHAKVVHASGVGSERKDSAPPFAFEPGLCDVRGPCDRGWLGSWVGSDTFRMFPRSDSEIRSTP